MTPPNAGSSTLVLLRHGESTWNQQNRFTGWTDVDLTERGVSEAKQAGVLLRDAGILVDVVHASLLRRALRTLHFALDGIDRLWVPVHKHWRLNERHYGALQGLNKAETTAKYGEEQVFEWRRSYDTPPPALEMDDERHPRSDARYTNLPPAALPATECLADVVRRVVPYWEDRIAPDLRGGHTVLVAAHGNSLRALVKYLDGMSDQDIPHLNIPTGIPLVYELDSDQRPLTHYYLGDADAARRAAEAVANQAKAGQTT